MHELYLKPAKTPVVLQMETVDCGAAVLGIILAYHGCYRPLNELREHCLVSRDGVSIRQLIRAAHQYGLRAQIYRDGMCSSLKVPAIVFWNHKHYVVLEGIKGNNVYINDPKLGRQIIDKVQFKQQSSGIFIELQKNVDFKKNKKPRLIQNDLVPLIQKQTPSFALWCAGILLLAFLNLSPLLCTKLFIDKTLLTRGDLSDWFFPCMGVCVLVQWLISLGTRRIFRRLETEMAIDLNKKIIHRLLALPTNFFMYRRASDLLSRVQAVDRLVGPIWSALGILCTSILHLFTSLMVLYYYSPLFSATALLVMVLHWLLNSYSRKKWHHVTQAAKARMTELTVFTASTISRIAQIKAQGAEAIYKEKWQAVLASYLKEYRQVAYKHQVIQWMHGLTFSFGYLFLVLLSIYSMSLKQLSIGELLACTVLFLSFNEMLTQRAQLHHFAANIEGERQQINDVLDKPTEVVSVTTDKPPALISSQGRVQLIAVNFGYSREFPPLLQAINLTIEPGTQVLISGASASGKSALANLLAGLFLPWSGAVLVDGVLLSNYSPEQRAALIGVVNQQQFFYQGSIKDNLCLGHDYSDEEVIKAMSLACIDELATHCQEGLYFQLTEGATNISGGQRQRLELARTLLTQPKILILDEATNSLDALIERKIRDNLSRHPATKIIINQRIKSLDGIDKVFILAHGTLRPHNISLLLKKVERIP